MHLVAAHGDEEVLGILAGGNSIALMAIVTSYWRQSRDRELSAQIVLFHPLPLPQKISC